MTLPTIQNDPPRPVRRGITNTDHSPFYPDFRGSLRVVRLPHNLRRCRKDDVEIAVDRSSLWPMEWLASSVVPVIAV